MAEPGRRAFAAIALPAALLLGALLRAAGGTALLSTNLTYGAAASGPLLPGARTPEDAARRFYLLVDRGEYGQAWELALEPDWAGGARLPYRRALAPPAPGEPGGAPFSWTAKEAFVARLTAELGAGGYGLKLNDVTAAREALPPAPGAASAPGGAASSSPDGAAPVFAPQVLHPQVLQRLQPRGVREVQAVRVSGSLLGACTIFRWEKSLPVARVGGAWRVLLPGTKGEKAFFYESWFADVQRIGSLREPAAPGAGGRPQEPAP